MADIRIQGVVQFWLTLCIFLILFLLENCAFNLSCLEVKTAYKERGLNENEVPIQAISGNHLEVCSQVSNCCTREMESKLKDLSTREYSINIEDAFRYHVENTFATGIRKFDEFFTSLIDKSQKKLHRMFRRTYGLLYLRGKHLFTSLFNDLREYCEGKNISLTSTLDIFFKSLFSQVFELLSAPRKFSDLYLKCVTSQIENLKPFGDVPGKLSTQVKKSFVAARTFVKGLAFGRDVSLEVLAIPPTKACNRALMKMMYCPHCRGLTQTKPCNNYCLNTMKGCLAYHSELNEVWNDYIEAMKQLASRLDGPFNMEAVVPRINVYISDAIMTLQENSLTVKEQVHNRCGKPNPQNMKIKRDTSSPPLASQSTLQESKVPGSLGQYDTAAGTSIEHLVKDIKEKVQIAKDFWVELPYTMCNNEQIAAQPENDTDCWNGKDIARYDSVVQKDGMMYQINNPEVKVDVNQANYIIEQQKIELKLIICKLNSAFRGEEVTWVKTGFLCEAQITLNVTNKKVSKGSDTYFDTKLDSVYYRLGAWEEG
ncbi:glypican-6-like [Saccostrea echinata]|uniref:glypican-6-like n=1 Tax=Saccostrea echinata TaxID=191078 RepID=UPI002A825BC6|nr:glypican-6-like [Saccostrea echinata]